MKAPDKIYIGLTNSEFGGVVYDTVSATFPNAKEYIRKDALLEWAKEKYEEYDRRIAGFPDDGAYWGQRNAFRQMIDKLSSI